jgi:hypothetical protein
MSFNISDISSQSSVILAVDFAVVTTKCLTRHHIAARWLFCHNTVFSYQLLLLDVQFHLFQYLLSITVLVKLWLHCGIFQKLLRIHGTSNIHSSLSTLMNVEDNFNGGKPHFISRFYLCRFGPLIFAVCSELSFFEIKFCHVYCAIFYNTICVVA